jgi:hypothetical protein
VGNLWGSSGNLVWRRYWSIKCQIYVEIKFVTLRKILKCWVNSLWLANLGRWNWTSSSHLIKVFISKRNNNVVPIFYWKLKSMCAFCFSFKMKVCVSNRFFFWNGFKCRVRTKKEGVIVHGFVGHFHNLVKHNLSTQSCFHRCCWITQIFYS